MKSEDGVGEEEGFVTKYVSMKETLLQVNYIICVYCHGQQLQLIETALKY